MRKTVSLPFFFSFILIHMFCFALSINANCATITAGYFYYGDTGLVLPDKLGLISGTATSNNITSNTKGISGVQLEFDQLTLSIDPDSFTLRHGNTNKTGNWASLSPENIVSESNKVTISWDSISIQDEWIEIKYSTNQYIYFGNLVGDANLDGSLTPIDALSVIEFLNNSSEYEYDYDINADGEISALDVLTIINRLNSGYSGLSIASGPFDPASGPMPFYFPQDRVVIYELFESSGTYALVTNPVAEPSTILLLGTGFIGLAGYWRKKFLNK